MYKSKKNLIPTCPLSYLFKEVYFFFAVGCDPTIEEHFRRSLGRDYSDYMAPPPKGALPPPPPLVATPPSPPVAATPTPATSAKVKMNAEVSITGEFCCMVHI